MCKIAERDKGTGKMLAFLDPDSAYIFMEVIVKKLVIGFMLVVVLLVIGACKTESDEVAATKVAESFFEALDKEDFGTAKKYASKETSEIIKMAEALSRQGAFDDEENQEEKIVQSHKVLSVKVDGENGVVNVEVTKSNDPENPETEEYEMVKEKGNWKVHMFKE